MASSKLPIWGHIFCVCCKCKNAAGGAVPEWLQCWKHLILAPDTCLTEQKYCKKSHSSVTALSYTVMHETTGLWVIACFCEQPPLSWLYSNCGVLAEEMHVSATSQRKLKHPTHDPWNWASTPAGGATNWHNPFGVLHCVGPWLTLAVLTCAHFRALSFM